MARNILPGTCERPSRTEQQKAVIIHRETKKSQKCFDNCAAGPQQTGFF